MANIDKVSTKKSNYMLLVENLADKRKTLHGYIAVSITDFREDSYIVDIQRMVTEVLLMLKDRTHCQIEWLNLMIQADMIDILLRVESISRRELNDSPAEAKAIRVIIRQLLSVSMLSYYKGEIFSGGGEEFIINAWEIMIGKMETDVWESGIVTNQVYLISEAVNAHAILFHQRGCEPTCKEFCQLVAFQGVFE